MSYKILIAAGGTGGHLFPAQQLAEELREKGEVVFAGHNLLKSPFFYQKFRAFDIRSSAPKKGALFRFLKETLLGFFESCKLLWSFSPDLVVGFGSYHTFPILLGAVFFRKKIVLFEPNARLGKVNRFFAPFAKTIGAQFFCHKKAVLTPFLPWGKKEKEPSQDEAFSYFGLVQDHPVILVFGGSQGASFLNEALPKAVPFFPKCQILHFTGKGKVCYEGVHAVVKEFEERMDLAYKAASVVVCRSGAGTIGGLIYYRKKALLIPFPLASENHQLENASFFLQETKVGSLLQQKDASPEKIGERISSLLQCEKVGLWDVRPKQKLAEIIFTSLESAGSG